jgi:hypothetical protein
MGRRCYRRVNQLGLAVYAYVRLHPEIPIFPLPRLVHLRIPLLVPVLGRVGHVQDGGVHNMARDYWKLVAGHSV